MWVQSSPSEIAGHAVMAVFNLSFAFHIATGMDKAGWR